MQLSELKKNTAAFMDKNAAKRDTWIKRNPYYYRQLVKFLQFNIPAGARVLEIGCGTGYLLDKVQPGIGVGIDFSQPMIEIARQKYPHLSFIRMDAENINIDQKFDYIIISDAIGYFEDIQRQFDELQKVSSADTRIIITYLNFLWFPPLKIAEFFKLKMPSKNINWLDIDDIKNLLALSGFQTVKAGKRCLVPLFIPFVSWFFNTIIAHLPLINRLCLINYIIARNKNTPPGETEGTAVAQAPTVSIIVPARNEAENIEPLVKQTPHLGSKTEIIFIEGWSSDNTREEISRVCEQYAAEWDLKSYTQEGKGKGDAVRKGFAMATGDIFMILDADLTVPPADLPKFYRAIISGEGELVNGSRLVYPLEKHAMRILNMMGNRFFSIMFSWLLGQKLKDTLCGTKAITRKNWEKVVKGRTYFGDFDPFGDFDLIFGAAKLNLKIVEIPIRYKARRYGQTNISRFKHGWLLLKMVFFAMWKIKFH